LVFRTLPGKENKSFSCLLSCCLNCGTCYSQEDPRITND
jgi:hypothetical protein